MPAGEKCCVRGCDKPGVPEDGYRVLLCADHLALLEEELRLAELKAHAVEARN